VELQRLDRGTTAEQATQRLAVVVVALVKQVIRTDRTTAEMAQRLRLPAHLSQERAAALLILEQPEMVAAVLVVQMEQQIQAGVVVLALVMEDLGLLS
jgi:hypothetical protein